MRLRTIVRLLAGISILANAGAVFAVDQTNCNNRPAAQDAQPCAPTNASARRPAAAVERRPAVTAERRPATAIEPRPAAATERHYSTAVERRPATVVERRPATEVERRPATTVEPRAAGTKTGGATDGMFGRDWRLSIPGGTWQTDNLVNNTSTLHIHPGSGDLPHVITISAGGTYVWTAYGERISGRWVSGNRKGYPVLLQNAFEGKDWNATMYRGGLLLWDGRNLAGQFRGH